MKKSGTTIVFILVCIGVLIAAFAIGVCIRKIRLGNESITASEKSPIELAKEREQARRMPGIEGTGGNSELSPEQRAELVEQRAEMRQRFENMTDEEREEFRAKMRERFSGRRGDSGPQLQLSDEERAKMREEINALREKWDQMSEAEREEARNQISEKYGFRPRGLGGGRRRSFMRPDAEEARPDEEQPEPDDQQPEPDDQQPEPDDQQPEPDEEQPENN